MGAGVVGVNAELLLDPPFDGWSNALKTNNGMVLRPLFSYWPFSQVLIWL